MAKSKHTTITRRVAIGGAVAAGTVALAVEGKGRVAPDVAAVPVVDPAVLLYRRIVAIEAEENHIEHECEEILGRTIYWHKESDDPAEAPYIERLARLRDDWKSAMVAFASTPASTPRGIAAKAVMLLREDYYGNTGFAGEIAVTAFADLSRLAGAAYEHEPVEPSHDPYGEEKTDADKRHWREIRRMSAWLGAPISQWDDNGSYVPPERIGAAS